MKLSTKAAVFKRVSLLYGGAQACRLGGPGPPWRRSCLQLSYVGEKQKLKLQITIYCNLPEKQAHQQMSKYTAVSRLQGARRKLLKTQTLA